MQQLMFDLIYLLALTTAGVKVSSTRLLATTSAPCLEQTSNNTEIIGTSQNR